MKAVFQKLDGALHAYGEEAEELLNSVGRDPVMIEIKKSRNPGNHARYFRFINDTFDMQDCYTNKEVWRKVLQMKAGHYEEVITEKGKVLYWPKSISWDQLEEHEFKKLFHEVIQAFFDYYGRGLDQNQINAILDYC